MDRTDFRQQNDRSERHNPQNRRWLITLVLLLGIVVVIVDRAREPGAWRWIDRLDNVSFDLPTGGVDNRLRPDDQQVPPLDSFIIESPEDAEAAPGTGGEGHFPGVNVELLKTVKDKTRFSSADRRSSLSLLDVLQRTGEQRLRKASEGRVTYAQLFQQPEYYRGRLVTISGTVVRANRIELPENKYDIRHYFEIVLYPNVRPLSPVLVYCLQLPEGFPSGDGLDCQAEATGFFFKLCVYRAKDALRLAPTILSKTVKWKRPPPALETPPIGCWRILWAVGVAVLSAIVVAWCVYLRTRTKPARYSLPDELPNLDSLQEMDRGNDSTENR